MLRERACEPSGAAHWRARARSPAARVSRRWLCVRKVVGDPNVPSGHFTAVADVSEAGAVVPVAAALPPGPVLQFHAGAAPRLIDLAEQPITAAFRATAFVNRDPRAFLAEAMAAKLLVVRSSGADAAGRADSGASVADDAAPRHFLLLWEDAADFPHVTSFSRLARA